MSDHGWGGGDWPDDLDPDSGGGDVDGGLGEDLGGDLGGGLGGDLGPDFAEAETADLGGADPTGDGTPDHTPDAPLDPVGDSTVDFPDATDTPADDPPTDGDAELTPVGADPDLDPHADGWTDQAFPEPLDLDAPEPVDGFPWTDPATLGTDPLPDPEASYQGAPEPTELASYAGEDLPQGADPWTALSASEDPATSSLARWWAPGT